MLEVLVLLACGIVHSHTRRRCRSDPHIRPDSMALVDCCVMNDGGEVRCLLQTVVLLALGDDCRVDDSFGAVV